MIVIKLGGIALICVIHAMILDIPIGDKPMPGKRLNRLNEDEMVLQERWETYKARLMMAEEERDNRVTMDNLLEDKKDE